MTVAQLKIKHRRERQARKVKMVKTGICFLLLTVAAYAFMYTALIAWEQEIENHGNYNRQYIQEMEEKRAK